VSGEKWIACLQYNYQKIRIGLFDNEKNAAKARDIVSVKYFKEFGKLNFPENIDEYKANLEDGYVDFISNLLPDGEFYTMEKDIVMVVPGVKSTMKPVKKVIKPVVKEPIEELTEELTAVSISDPEEIIAMEIVVEPFVPTHTKAEVEKLSLEEMLAYWD
jgi:hypothetical protein